jgi:hypothetical protein
MAAENTYPHHTRDRFAWLDQVLADRVIPDPAFRVAYALSSFVNRKSGAAWPSHATLAQKTGLGESTVRRHLVTLHSAGHLAVELHRGRNGTNRYRPIIRLASAAENGNAESDEAPENRSEMSGTAPLNSDDRTAHFWTSDRSEVSENPSEEPTAPPRGADWERDDVGRAAPPDGGARSEEDDGWREFWQLWQRGHGDDEAKVRTAYVSAIRQHGEEAILASARRWRAAREPQYLPKPVPWLEGGWRDDPPQRQAAGHRNGRRHGAAVDPVEAMLKAGGVL